MPTKLKLTGRKSFQHPLTYGKLLRQNEVILSSDVDATVLQAVTNRDVNPNVPMFTVLSGSETVKYDFSGLRSGAAPGTLTPAAYTRESLRLAAEANQLIPGATYRTTEGVLAFAKTSRFLNSPNWFSSGQRWRVGSATAYTTFPSVMLPPIDVSGGICVSTGGQMSGSTLDKRIALVLGGTVSDAPGSSGVNVTFFEKVFNSATLQYAWETDSIVRCAGVSGLLSARAVGASAPGIDTSTTTLAAAAKRLMQMDLGSSKLLRAAMRTVLNSGTANISGLVASDGYAYGSVPAGTFGTSASLVRTGIVASAGAGGFNLSPVDVQVLTAGLPSPVPAAPGTDTTTATLFRYPVQVGNGSAGGAPTLQLYEDLVLDYFSVSIDQGSI